MKKRNYIIMLLILSLLMNTFVFGQDTFLYNEPIRVGLVALYEEKSSIKILNKSLSVGYQLGTEYNEEFQVSSSTGFVAEAALHSYVISEQTYNSYQEVLEKVSELKEKGFNAYAGNQAIAKWKVYIGNAETENEANVILNNIINSDDLNYVVVNDNGNRTILHTDSDPIVFENMANHISFKANELTNSVPVLNLVDRSYRGKVEIGRYNKSGVSAINIVDLNDYLYGVLPAEMPRTWPSEALKAQAVAARNYVIYYKYIHSKYPNEAYDVVDTINSQVYKGFNYEYEETNRAVLETQKKLIYYDNKLIVAFFFSTSGGHTENSENVWTTPTVYLKGKPDIYESHPERDSWLLTLSTKEIEQKLSQNGINVGNVSDISVTSYTSGGRAMGLKITGSNKSYILEKETMRYWLGLDSRKFELISSGYTPNTNYAIINGYNETSFVDYDDAYVVSEDNVVKLLKNDRNQLVVVSKYNIENIPLITGTSGEYTFAGVGWGHGVGMSQSGARGMALAGFTYKEILEYYYDGTEVK